MTTNLARLGRRVVDYPSFSAEQGQLVEQRVQQLQEVIENEPKTGKWKLRARIGPRKKWYQEVAEKSATY